LYKICSFALSTDAEYELEEVWDGKKWHVTKKLVPTKPASSSKDSEKPGKPKLIKVISRA